MDPKIQGATETPVEPQAEEKEPELSQEEKDARIKEIRQRAHDHFDNLLDLGLVWEKDWAGPHGQIIKELKKYMPKTRAAAKPKTEKIEEEIVNMPDDVFEALLEKRRQKKNAGGSGENGQDIL
jgi:hypothetical protein